MRQAPSVNYDARLGPVDMLVLHYTGMRSAEAAIARLCDPAAQVSSHYVVEEDGTTWQLVPEAARAWHAGVSHWRGHAGLNDRSIGIEVVNPGHEWGYRPFPAVQMAAVSRLCLGVLARHAIPARNVVGHSDIAPDRKQDPGELFDWPVLAAQGIGLWPQVGAASADDVLGALGAVGYRTDLPLPVLVSAFQRHWRPAAVTGLADDATRRCLAAVRAVCGA